MWETGVSPSNFDVLALIGRGQGALSIDKIRPPCRRCQSDARKFTANLWARVGLCVNRSIPACSKVSLVRLKYLGPSFMQGSRIFPALSLLRPRPSHCRITTQVLVKAPYRVVVWTLQGPHLAGGWSKSTPSKTPMARRSSNTARSWLCFWHRRPSAVLKGQLLDCHLGVLSSQGNRTPLGVAGWGR